MEEELKTYLASPEDFSHGPSALPSRRETPSNPEIGFTLRDGNYLSARWPGDAHRMGRDFVEMLREFEK